MLGSDVDEVHQPIVLARYYPELLIVRCAGSGNTMYVRLIAESDPRHNCPFAILEQVADEEYDNESAQRKSVSD